MNDPEPSESMNGAREKLARLVTLVEVMREDVGDLKERVRSVERWMWLQIGAASVAGGGAGYLASVFAGAS